jgi:hypothetical protein
MTTLTFEIDPEAPLLVEFEPDSGLVLAARSSPLSEDQLEALAGRSAQALNSAMSAIRQMARRVTATIQSLPALERPTTLELEFGLKLDAEAGALVARAGAEAGFNVRLVWEREARPVATIPHVQP